MLNSDLETIKNSKKKKPKVDKKSKALIENLKNEIEQLTDQLETKECDLNAHIDTLDKLKYDRDII